MKAILSIFLVLTIAQHAVSQDQFAIDSLNIQLANAKHDSTRIQVLTDLSKSYFGTDLAMALDYIDQALEIVEESNLDAKHVKLHRAKGGILSYIGRYDEAINNYLEGLTIAERINQNDEVFVFYNNLGVIYERLDDSEKALASYNKGLEVYGTLSPYLKNRTRDKLGALYSNIGNIYLEEGEFESALSYFEKSLIVGEDFGDVPLQITVYLNLTALYGEQGFLEKTLENINRGMALAISANDLNGQAKCYNAYSYYYSNRQDFETALLYADSSIQMADKIGSISTKIQAVENVFQIQEALGNHVEALNFYKEFHLLSDSLINESTINEITKAQIQYEYNKVEQERLILQERARFIRIIIGSSLLLGLVIAILLFILSRNRIKRIALEKENLEQEVELRNKELAMNVMYLVKKNELINQEAKRLLNLKSKLKEENREALQSIIFDLQAINSTDVWEEFEMRFKQVHLEFYEKLQAKFPDLTPSEIKLAAFLKLNMTTKDIASITNQSIKGMEVARSRLRKKLGITSQKVNLVTFLSEL